MVAVMTTAPPHIAVSASRMTTLSSRADWPVEAFVARLVKLASRGLPAMYRPEQGLFCHHDRPGREGLIHEGVSPRYTAMVLIGASRLGDAEARGLFAGQSPADVCRGLVNRLETSTNLGDVAVAAWAAAANELPCADVAMARAQQLWRVSTDPSTVETAWMRLLRPRTSLPKLAW